jgi:dihydrolipoamide dehydrogenase
MLFNCAKIVDVNRAECAVYADKVRELGAIADKHQVNREVSAAVTAGAVALRRNVVEVDAYACGEPEALRSLSGDRIVVAAEAAAGEKSFFDARVIPSVAYTDPEIAWVGLTEEQARAQGLTVAKASFPWAASGRAIANGRDEGFTKLIFDETSHRLLGGAIVGTHAGDMIGELALAIEMGADATDIGRTIHPHPTLGETIGMAAELFEGVCTDLPPATRRH